MSREDLERRISWFDQLVPKAAVLHPNTWCVRQQMVIMTRDLKGRICYECANFIENGGICDPL